MSSAATVQWEKIKKYNITQCHTLERIGHTAKNCNLNYCCVKCIHLHGPGECKIKKEDVVSKGKIYCVNCKNFGYPASYKGCPKLVELHKKLNEKITKAKKTKTERIAKISRKYVPELKFADVVNQGTSQNQAIENPPQLINTNQNPNPTVNIPQLNIINVIENFNINILKVLNEQQKQLNEMKKSLKTQEERIDSIFSTIDSINESNFNNCQLNNLKPNTDTVC